MGLQLWLILTGVAILLLGMGLRNIGRRQANSRLLARGARVHGEILENTRQGRFTSITYKFLPNGAAEPRIETRRMDGLVSLHAGQQVTVCYLPLQPFVSLILECERYHDTS